MKKVYDSPGKTIIFCNKADMKNVSEIIEIQQLHILFSYRIEKNIL